MSYLNLAVEVAALPNAKYRIAVQSPIGEASVDADSPFTDAEIIHYLQVLSREQRVPRQDELNTASDFGQRLFAFLFHSSSEVGNAYFGSLLDAGSSDGLRIRLTVDQAGALSELPWEFLRDPSNDFLALSRRTPIVRYTQQLNVRPPSTISLPLRVLVMISAPQDFPALDVEGEWQRLQEATAPLRDKGMLQLERLDTATLIALQRRLRAQDYHVFHYIGHSDYDPASQQGVLVFESERDNQKGQIISGTALSRELAEESTVRLVVLNSCHSANRPPADALAGISSSLVTRGIPAVVAMQFAITDSAAKAFAEEFYRSLSDLIPLDAAMSEGRRAIANRVGNSEWGTPVLFMRSDDGVLFRTVETMADDSRSPAAAPTPKLAVSPRNNRAILFGGIALLIVLALAIIGIARILTQPPPTPEALPDLQIGTIRISPPHPAPGQIFILSIPIINAGSAASGGFHWSWDASEASPQLLNSLDGEIGSIPAGASKNLSFPFSYGWWGTYISQLHVDADSQVAESDERNNNLPFEVDMALLPFEVDFSLLPTNELVTPPMTVTSTTFSNWNLVFALDASGAPDCASTPLTLVAEAQDVLLTPGGDDDACKTLPLSITILRAPVSAATLEIIPAADGTAQFTYYGDSAGQNVIFQSPEQSVIAGEVTQLAPDDDTAGKIQRIDLSVPGQSVRLTRLLLSPPSP